MAETVAGLDHCCPTGECISLSVGIARERPSIFTAAARQLTVHSPVLPACCAVIESASRSIFILPFLCAGVRGAAVRGGCV